jgi:hypothetical protein
MEGSDELKESSMDFQWFRIGGAKLARHAALAKADFANPQRPETYPPQQVEISIR